MEVFMNRMLIVTIVLLLCGVVNLYSQNDRTDLKQSIQKLEDQWSQAWVANDVNKLGSLYTDDAISMQPDQPMFKGKDEILAGDKKQFESGIKYKSTVSKTQQVYGTGDIVYEIGTYSSVFTPANSTEEVTDNGKYVKVWQKQSDGSWKIKTDTWNSDPNPKMQAGAKTKD